MVNPKIILLVDDDEDDREMFFEAIGEISSNIKCITAEDGEKALAYLFENESLLPDLIFLDLNMPRMNGKQCLAEIKKTDSLKHIPVIIYSTTKREEDVEETRKMGAVYFLTKPTLFNEITGALLTVFSKIDFLKKVDA
jgi:CheY-like chemotaxis protein